MTVAPALTCDTNRLLGTPYPREHIEIKLLLSINTVILPGCTRMGK
jgi:hypothetical protein